MNYTFVMSIIKEIITVSLSANEAVFTKIRHKSIRDYHKVHYLGTYYYTQRQNGYHASARTTKNNVCPQPELGLT